MFTQYRDPAELSKYIYPLSFKEYYNFVGGDKSEAYEEYAMYGGMPLTLSKKNDMGKMQ